MNLAQLSIRRPIFITSLVLLMLTLGWSSLNRLGIDLFPDVSFPVIVVSTPYEGAGPQEIEELVTKPLEDSLSTISGLKRLTSTSYEGISQVVAEFHLDVDIHLAEQEIRDKINAAKPVLPLDTKESVIKRIDPADSPIFILSVSAKVAPAELFDLVNRTIKPQLEQVSGVGEVKIAGGRNREIQVLLSREALVNREMSVSNIVRALQESGENIPNGKVNSTSNELSFRSLGQFDTLQSIGETTVSLYGNDRATKISDVGTIFKGLEDEKTRVFVNGKKSLIVSVYKQSGTNTIEVIKQLKKKITGLEVLMKTQQGSPKIQLIRDGGTPIFKNVTDVKESIFLGIILTMLVVYFFLGNARSTWITSLALPNSLLGAFILMAVAGFTLNVVSLLALSLSVGLLIDDAIVVRENIYRQMEKGLSPQDASLKGTQEVQLAVIATTLVILAVFGPVAFMDGIVGRFLKQFGLTICFAMLISLFDALTIAPMLSTYLGKSPQKKQKSKIELLRKSQEKLEQAVKWFDVFQTKIEIYYKRVLEQVLKAPKKTLKIAGGIFILSLGVLSFVPKTFMPPHDNGEFSVLFELPAGTNLDATQQAGERLSRLISSVSDVEMVALTVGTENGQSYKGDFYVRLKNGHDLTTSEARDAVRKKILTQKDLSLSDFQVKEFSAIGGMETRPFTLNFMGSGDIQSVASAFANQLKKNSSFKEVDISVETGKPEFQISFDSERTQMYGVNTSAVGKELRTQVQGVVPAFYRENGTQYDIRVRMAENERDLQQHFHQMWVQNVNGRMIRLSDVASGLQGTGPVSLDRQDRMPSVLVSADLAIGVGLAEAMTESNTILKTLNLPSTVRPVYIGNAENFEEMGKSFGSALGFSILFIFLILASLYESFITPLTIMVALPLALCGAFLGLFLTQEPLSLMSMLGIVMLLGVSAKNSILLVDYIQQLVGEGIEQKKAIMQACQTRLRPILMTSFALIFGTLPVALGLSEVAKDRVGMGIAIIGGVMSSTLLTLVVVPALYGFIEKLRLFIQKKVNLF